MKKIFTLLIVIVFSLTVLVAQEAPPQAFSFKATIQGANGQTVVNKMIRLRISILQDDMNGFPVYSEFFTPTTNHYSQVDVEIGRGNVLSGIFPSIDWSAHKYFLKIEVDAKGGTDYQLLSVTELLSVPYAMYAGAVANLNEADPIFSISPAYGITSSEIINWNTAFDWGDHSKVGYLRSEVDGSVTNEIQDLTLIADKLKITNNPDAAEIDLTPYIADGSETKIMPGTNVTVDGVGTEANPYIINSTGDAGNLTLEQVLINGNDAKEKNIKNLSNPVDKGDAVTKAYVDELKDRIEDLMGLVVLGTKINDLDGNIYNIVTIGNQVWMAENLRTTKLNDGTPMVLIDDWHDWNHFQDLRNPDCQVVWYDFETANKLIYGGLYNFAAIESNKLCPTGWHVPSFNEWDALIDYLGGPEAGDKMKETGNSHWLRHNERSTNESGFTALPGGFFRPPSEGLGRVGYWWGRNGYKMDLVSITLTDGGHDAQIDTSPDTHAGYSVRCIKD